jgi:hypothetical protein
VDGQPYKPLKPGIAAIVPNELFRHRVEFPVVTPGAMWRATSAKVLPTSKELSFNKRFVIAQNDHGLTHDLSSHAVGRSS